MITSRNALPGTGYDKRLVVRVLIESMLIVFAVFIIIPFLWIIATSLRPVKESFQLPPAILPTQFQWQNYAEVFRRFPFFGYIANSIKVAVLAVSAQLFVNGLAAYGFSRIKFSGRDIMFFLILVGMMVPGQVIIIPLFVVMVNIGLIDTHAGLILPSIVYPLTLFLMRQYMMTIPKSYEEAAFIDGASRLRVFFSIIIPMVKPAIGVAATLHFVSVWNDFFRPLILLSSPDMMTLPLGLRVLDGYLGNGNLAVVLAGVVLSFVVPLLVFIATQRYLIEGMRIGGGLKG